MAMPAIMVASTSLILDRLAELLLPRDDDREAAFRPLAGTVAGAAADDGLAELEDEGAVEEQLTKFVPSKVEPELREQETGPAGSSGSVAVALQLAVAPEGPVASTAKAPGT